MNAENLLEKIGFTTQMQGEYRKFRAIADEKITLYAKDYFEEKITIQEAEEKLKTLDLKDMHMYTANLIFVLECAGWLEEKYLKNGRTEEMFIRAVKDILFKVMECKKRFKILGCTPLSWYDGFFRMRRFAATRLQFDKTTHQDEPIKLSNYTVEKGDLIFNCHIPSGEGPLTYEKRLASYKDLYNFYKDDVKDGILVIHCASWLLFPEYLKSVYSETSNIVDFSKDFEMYGTVNQSDFSNAWRVFYKDFSGDASILPQETSLQRAFVNYLEKQPENHGYGCGVILFDGEKILTRK